MIGCKGPAGDTIVGSSGKNGNNGQSIVGPAGPTGSPGSNGSNGINGLNGSNGLDGTIITWVQFCPGSTNYPSTFIEGGFCINNNLYAVYSANNGFLTLIPPGNYSSNAIGSRCSFTVLPNCQIQ